MIGVAVLLVANVVVVVGVVVAVLLDANVVVVESVIVALRLYANDVVVVVAQQYFKILSNITSYRKV